MVEPDAQLSAQLAKTQCPGDSSGLGDSRAPLREQAGRQGVRHRGRRDCPGESPPPVCGRGEDAQVSSAHRPRFVSRCGDDLFAGPEDERGRGERVQTCLGRVLVARFGLECAQVAVVGGKVLDRLGNR